MDAPPSNVTTKLLYPGETERGEVAVVMPVEFGEHSCILLAPYELLTHIFFLVDAESPSVGKTNFSKLCSYLKIMRKDSTRIGGILSLEGMFLGWNVSRVIKMSSFLVPSCPIFT